MRTGWLIAGEKMAMKVLTDAFENGQAIPEKYTCFGENHFPSLVWTEVPAKAKTLALIVEDPDAPNGTFTHWVLYNVPVSRSGLTTGTLPHRGVTTEGTLQGTNDFDRVGWDGPKPPPGKPHRYYFRLYALDAPLDLEPGVHADEVRSAMEGHVVDSAELVGRFQHPGAPH
jgi:hypothetical protein